MQAKPANSTAAEQYRLCEVCDQRYDTADQEQVFHHTPDLHRPLLVAPAQSVDGTQFKACTVCGQTYDSHDFSAHAHHTASSALS